MRALANISLLAMLLLAVPPMGDGAGIGERAISRDGSAGELARLDEQEKEDDASPQLEILSRTPGATWSLAANGAAEYASSGRDPLLEAPKTGPPHAARLNAGS